MQLYSNIQNLSVLCKSSIMLYIPWSISSSTKHFAICGQRSKNFSTLTSSSGSSCETSNSSSLHSCQIKQSGNSVTLNVHLWRFCEAILLKVWGSKHLTFNSTIPFSQNYFFPARMVINQLLNWLVAWFYGALNKCYF